MNVVVLVGGVGGAKLAHGLAQILPPEHLTVIVNTGDDFWHLGLRVCPDVDTIMYTLGGVVNREFGWGVAGDTRHMLAALRDHYGHEPWFGLGDKDLATHLLRTQLLRAGETLTQVTARLTKNLNIPQRILPMTDDPVATMVDTIEQGVLEFQEYFVLHRWQPTVKHLWFEGVEDARPTEAVTEALASADIILIGPSNPWLSIDPILALPGVRDLIRSRSVPRVAISPIVGGAAIKGPAAKLMRELGYSVSAEAVADYYGDLLNGFVYDVVDAGIRISLSHHANCEIVMKDESDRAVLAQTVLDWIKSWVSVER